MVKADLAQRPLKLHFYIFLSVCPKVEVFSLLFDLLTTVHNLGHILGLCLSLKRHFLLSLYPQLNWSNTTNLNSILGNGHCCLDTSYPNQAHAASIPV